MWSRIERRSHRAGAEATAHVRNFLNRPQTYRLALHCPEGIVAEPAVLEGIAPPTTTVQVPLRLKATSRAKQGVQLIALDATLDGRRYGEWFDFTANVADVASEGWQGLSDDLSAFQKPTGQWFVAGNANMDAKNDHRLTGTAVWSQDYPASSWAGETLSPNALLSDFVTYNRALTPAEAAGLYATGTPQVLPPPADSIPVTFTINQPGYVSLNLFYSSGTQAGQLARTLLVNAVLLDRRPADLYWDGLDDAKNPVPRGTEMTVKAECSNLQSVWDAKVGNTSPSETGALSQYRTGYYYDVAPLPNGGLATMSYLGEGGDFLQAISGSAGYPVLWNGNDPLPIGAISDYGVAVATDNPAGYNLSQIVSDASYSDARRAYQTYDVAVHTVGSAPGDFVALSSVNVGYFAGAAGWTQVEIGNGSARDCRGRGSDPVHFSRQFRHRKQFR